MVSLKHSLYRNFLGVHFLYAESRLLCLCTAQPKQSEKRELINPKAIICRTEYTEKSVNYINFSAYWMGQLRTTLIAIQCWYDKLKFNESTENQKKNMNFILFKMSACIFCCITQCIALHWLIYFFLNDCEWLFILIGWNIDGWF